jgi:hypothetical protein
MAVFRDDPLSHHWGRMVGFLAVVMVKDFFLGGAGD